MKDRAIILSAFGTSTSALDTYAFVEEKFLNKFPEEDIFLAFTSNVHRKKLEMKGTAWKSSRQVLKTLKHEGYKSAALQSLHIVPGIEFQKETIEAEKSHLNISVGTPLLSSEIDCYRVLDILSVKIPDTEEHITVFVGHGTVHSGGGAMYMQFEGCVKSRYEKNVFVSMIEGVPSWESVLEDIKRANIKKIKFIPLMFEAGDHLQHDVLGDHGNAWKSQLVGYEIDGSEKGLGYNEDILEIFYDHLQTAISRL